MQQANIIQEITMISSDYEIIEETNVPSASGGLVNKAICRVKLQTAKEDNQNGRYYEVPECKEIVKILKPKAKDRSLYMEVDHPFVASDTQSSAAKLRAVRVHLNNSGALLRDIFYKDPDIIGEIETLSGFKGPDLYNIMVNDRAKIGFSIRLFARIVKDDISGRMYVRKPLRPITYDIVTNPSHKTASVLEFLPETDLNLGYEYNQELITEAYNILNEDSINIRQITDVDEYHYDLINEAYENSKVVNFKIN
jgi:hypothetical protein